MLEEYGLHELVWETCDQVFPDVFVASAADAEGRGISLSVLEGGEACDLTGARVYLAWRHELTRATGTTEFEAVDASAGTFRLFYPAAMEQAEGEIAAQVVVSIGDERAVSSRVFRIRCEKVVVGGEEVEDGFTLFVEAIKAYEKATVITYAAADAANEAAADAAAVRDGILADKAAGLFNGADGAQGPAGPQGEKGEKGDTGEAGPVGATGPAGEKGDTGATGPKGDKGDKGDTGETGPRGETGLQGPKGDAGSQGPAGSDGLAATIAVGTVATGDTPSVVNVGTANAAIFNFVFPKAEGGSGMNVTQIQYVSKSGGSRSFCKGALPGMCYYDAGANALYSWDGSAWASAAIDSGAFYAFQGQLYPVVSGVIWGLGENWGSRDIRSYVSEDESGYMDVAVVSDSATIRQRELPTALSYSSAGSGYGQGSNYVKRVDLSGCSASSFGESANTGVLQGLTSCQELLLPTDCTLYSYYFLQSLNSGNSTSPNTILGYGSGGRKRPVLYFNGSVDAGTGPGIAIGYSSFIRYAVCDFVHKGTGNTTLLEPATIGGMFAQYLASRFTATATYNLVTIQDVLHYDLWGMYSVNCTATGTGYSMFYVTSNVDCVYEVGSASFPVTQGDLDGWGGLTYWARQTGTGKLILVLCTDGGVELTVPEHAGAADLVVAFRDAAARTVAAFHARYDFATNFNTSTTADPRPDLSAEGVVYQ